MKKGFLCIALFFFAYQINAQKLKVTLLIKNINIVDVANNAIIAHQTIAIQDDHIEATGSNLEMQNKYIGEKWIDAQGKYIMPSLWDMHVHFGGDTLINENKLLLPLYIAMGVSYVRDCAGDISPSVIQWKHQINNNELLGPTIFTSGPKLEGIKSIWPGDLEIGTEAELQLALDSLKKLKVDFVKITDNTLAPDLFLKSIIAARKRGWKVTGHIPSSLPVSSFVQAGLSAIEHIGYLQRAASDKEDSITQLRASGKINSKEANELYLNSFNKDTAISKFKTIAQMGTAVVPTINGSYKIAYLDQIDYTQDAYLKYLGPALKRTYQWRVQRAANDNEEAIVFRHKNFEAAAHLLPLLYESGVTILAGTDAGYLNSYNYPGLGMHEELAMFVKYGLTPQQALACSIINGPAFFNLEKEYGAVSKNKKADLLLLNSNPLVLIQNTQDIFGVIRKGVYLNRKGLDTILSKTSKAVQALK